MLDPLTAIGVASSVMQLVDFSSKVVARSGEIRRAGVSIDVAQLEDHIGLERLDRVCGRGPRLNLTILQPRKNR
jgi:hypothetical protein